MASFARRVLAKSKKAAKISIFLGGAAGAVKVTHMSINDDLDDIGYAFKSFKNSAMSLWRPASGEKKRVVVLGSGWGALSFVRKLDSNLYDVKVISPRPFFFYTPLLCGSCTGVVSTASIIEPIRKESPPGSYLRAECKSVDVNARQVHCTDTSTGNTVSLPYDHLIVAVGAQPNTFNIPGVAEHGMYLKEIEHGMKVRKKILNCLESANVAWQAGDMEMTKRLLTFVVVGGGPTGVEFCAELSDFMASTFAQHLPQELYKHVNITLVEALPRILTMFKQDIGQYVEAHLAKQEVRVRLKTAVSKLEETKVHLKCPDGSIELMDYGALIWVAGVGMRPFTKQLCESIGKDKGQSDRRGLVVDSCLRVKGAPLGEVFAIGDCAVSGKPPTAQVAAQQGKYLGRMFRLEKQHCIEDPEAPAFHYNHQGSMAYIGQSQGAAQLNPNSFGGLGGSKITDHMFWRALYDDEEAKITGGMGFVMWRSVYFSKLCSDRSRFKVALDWTAMYLFGRQVASPVMNLSSD